MGSTALTGCSARFHREQADRAAEGILSEAAFDLLGREADYDVTPPEDDLRRELLLGQELPHVGGESLGVRDLEPTKHWPEDEDLVSAEPSTQPTEDVPQVLRLSVTDALEIAARQSRDYQVRKERVFRSALGLELERDAFRGSFTGLGDSRYLLDGPDADTTLEGFDGGGELSFSQRLQNGMTFAARVGLDLAQALQPGKAFSRSLFGDASITIPLLRGSGKHIVGEPLTQAERDVAYEIWDFERFKKEFAVDVYSSYLDVLAAADQVANQEQNYRGLITSSRRARRLAEAGKLPQIQVDQSIQDELRSRESWIRSKASYERALDQFKVQIGLPADAVVELDREEFGRVSRRIREILGKVFEEPPLPPNAPADAPVTLRPPDRAEAGPFELQPGDAVRIALLNRLDLLIQVGEVFDAQRRVVVAADALRAELTLLGSVATGERRSVGSATSDDVGSLDFGLGTYEGLLTIDLPLERTAEAISYRASQLDLQQAVRDVQDLEDQVKLQVRDRIRQLEQVRASLAIQSASVRLAERRVRGADLELEAGRAQIRDLLEAQEDLVASQNALTAAMVGYRVAELQMLLDLGVLEVDDTGLWQDIDPRDLRVAIDSQPTSK